MIKFIIKKAFFDTWDNLIRFFIFNLMTIPFILITYFGFSLAVNRILIGFLFVAIGVVLLVIHQATIFYFLRDIGNCNSVSFKDYIKYLKQDFKIKVQFAFAWTGFITITSISIVYYLGGDSLVTLIPLALVFWFTLMTGMATLFFFPIKIRLEGNFTKVLKKCFIILLDNPGAGIFVFIYTLILFILSIPSIGLLPPGLSSIGCVIDTTVHMFELKYDYLDNNPDADRKKIPWTELTYELNENIGPRSLKGMIFPWKD